MHRAFNVFSKLTLLLAVLSLSFTGCGYRRPAQVKTTGTVTLDGEPVANAALMFIPDSGRPASGNTNTNGEFQVSSFGGNDGLPAGNYRVTATKLVLKDRFQQLYDRQVFPQKFFYYLHQSFLFRIFSFH